MFLYVPLALILVIVFVDGLSIIYRDQFPYQTHEITDEDAANFKIAAPFVCGFFFFLLTAYFLRFYLQTVAPLIRDVKRKEKLLATVQAEKFDMGLLNKYYISTPIKRVRHISIEKSDFYKLSEHMPLTFELAPNSTEILRIFQNGIDISFH
jgi:hypothetical protein